MNKKEGKILVDKCMEVVLSCKTIDQLNIAVKYAGLVYKQLSKHIGLLNSTMFITRIERSIGYAQCQINLITNNQQLTAVESKQ